jgi:CBS domain-containing protein
MPRIGDVMSGNLLTTEATTPLQQAAERMCERGIGASLVLNGNGALVGILTERDVLRAVSQGGIEGTHVAAWMTRDPETVGVDDTTRTAAELMVRGGFRHVPVVDGDQPVGIVSIRDLMRIVVED